MKPTSTSLLLCSIATFVSLSFAQGTVGPMVNGTRVCTLECRTEKPDCPSGEAPMGSEGCWGCCQPINPVTVKTATTTTSSPTADVCAQEICHTDPPRCQAGWQPMGIEGCWTRCCTQGSMTQTGTIGTATSGPANSTVLTTSTVVTDTTTSTTNTNTNTGTETNTAPGSYGWERTAKGGRRSHAPPSIASPWRLGVVDHDIIAFDSKGEGGGGPMNHD